MGNANHIRGRNCSLRLWDTSGGSFPLTGDGNSFTLTYSTALLETAAFGDGTRTHFPDIKDYTVNFAGFYNASCPAKASSCTAACRLSQSIGASEGVTFQVSPAGSAAGGTCPNYSGCVHLENLDTDFPADGMCTYSFTLRPRTGSLTFGHGNW